MTRIRVTERDRARAFVTFCDGLEEAGLAEYARRGRAVADDLLIALDELAYERSARVVIQQARDRAVELLGKNADDALIAELRRR